MRYLTSDCVFSTAVQVVVLNSCVDRFGFVVGEWHDRGTTEATVLVVFCLLFFFFGTNLASHARYKRQSQFVVLITCSSETRCQAPRRHNIVFFLYVRHTLLWLYCVRRFIGSFFFWVVRLGEGCQLTFLHVFGVFRSRHADPPTPWREHVQCAWLHSLLTEKGMRSVTSEMSWRW